MQVCYSAAEHVAFRDVETVGPSGPSAHLTADIRAKDVRSRDCANMRIIDAHKGRRLVSCRIMNHFPVVFRSGNDAVVVGIESQVDGLLSSVDVGQSQLTVSSCVDD